MLASNVMKIPPIPPSVHVPPGWSGAPEIIVHHLTEELVAQGHDVTLFASGDSVTSAHLESVTNQATWRTVGVGPHELYEHLLISHAYTLARKGKFDIIHSHFDTRTASYAPLVPTPTISTLHSPLEGTVKDILSHYMKTQYYASISNNQRKGLPDLQYAVTAYNGVEIERIPFSDTKEDYFIFVGRLVPEKGVALAIQVAQKTKHKLLIFGSYDESVDKNKMYWRKHIKPHIDDRTIVYHGMVSRDELFQFISRAKAFLFPLQWDEPFGLVTVEAMAAGTPTIAFRRGSMPEIIEHGKSGLLVENLDEMIAATQEVSRITPQNCQERAKEFSISRMADRYEEAYHTIIERYLQGVQ